MRSATRSGEGSAIVSTISAVGEEDDGVGIGGRGRVVGDHHDGLVEAVDGLPQQGEDLLAGSGVERAGGLVGEDHLGLRDERAGDRDALLLAA